MIVRFLNNSTPYTSNGALTKINSSLIIREDEDIPRAFETFNIGDYQCCYEEYAFADLSDTDTFKNDITSFLFKLSTSTDTLELKLFKNCEEVAVLDDNTYGTVYDSAYFGDDLRKGFKLDWRLVANGLGFGNYHVEANREILNQDSSVESHTYLLRPFSESLANDTVRVITYSEGIIEGGADYTGAFVQWEQRIRLRGKFGNPSPTFETDNYLDTTRKVQQIQDQITTDYELEIEGVPSEIAKPLIYDKLLANQIFITDYNLFNFDKYENFAVYPSEIVEFKTYAENFNAKIKIRFTDKKQNIIKRNFL